MRKVTCAILFLILFETCAIVNFSWATKPAKKRNVDDKDYQNQQPMVVELLEEEYADEYTNKESDISGQPIGRWRSTGKALEPKWRDGDSIPLVPFRSVTISSKPTIKKKQNSHDIDNTNKYTSGQHWQSQRQEKGAIITNEYNYNTSEKPNSENNYPNFRSRETRLSRRRKPPQFEDVENHQTTIRIFNETKDLHESNKEKKENKPITRTPKLPHNTNDYLEGVALRYRETFQNYPSEYELNDEYQRPRSRKRRPPQNDDFIEYKSSPLSTSTEKSTTYSTTRSQRKQENTRRNNLIRTNHNRTIKASSHDKSSENSELKSLLKMQQVEGLSLSEILQRRNLTLSDLLQGRADVINLLKSKHIEENSEEELNAKTNSVEMMKISASSTITNSATSEKAPTISHKPIIPFRNFVKKEQFSSFRAPSTHAFRKILPTQEVRPTIRPTESMNVKMKISTEIPLIDTTTIKIRLNETERTKIIYDEDEIMEFSDFTIKDTNSKRENISETKEFDKINIDSETTLSIEHLLSPTIQPEMNEFEEERDKFLQQSRERIQLENKIPHSEQDEISDSKEIESFEVEYQNDGGHNSGIRKMFTNSDSSNSFEESDSSLEKSSSQEKNSTQEKNSPQKENSSQKETFDQAEKNIDDSLKNHRSEEIYFEMEPDARAEILELFNSGNSASKLESLLKARNMSLDDLIALRQRGSSHLHLAQASLNRENPKVLRDDREIMDIPMEIKILKPDCPPKVKEFIEWMKEKEMKKEPQREILHIKEFETLPPVWSGFGNFNQPEKEISENTETDKENTEIGVNLEANDFMNILSHFKSSEPYNDDEKLSSTKEEIPSSNFSERKNNNTVIPIEDGHVREIVSDISNTFNNIFKLNTEEGGSSEERHSISRVRTSIIVSGAILGVTIIVFLGIFIVCRVRQKKKYTYNNTFSRAVFQSPVLAGRKLSNTSSLNTIMVNVVATSTTKRPEKGGYPETDDDFDIKSEIEHDSLDANDSWETIPDFMK
ncbi:uncharacterized protein LOC122507729 [Leptopilina heterotoma]|uniref:uncharacterized protein LOC122507729 n=1 Tax=Leptopilina heterotoma TaxID=63436 RepID=UPI001CA7B917|nr:uncharacterized protein LOC122507729 [Leptopilina heterotoma]